MADDEKGNSENNSHSKPKLSPVKDNAVEWKYEDDGEWLNYDPETTSQLEENLVTSLQRLATLKANRLQVQVKLDRGSLYGTEDNKQKYIVLLFVDARTDPPIIQRALMYHVQRKSEIVNVSRFPPMDTDLTDEYMYDFNNYTLRYQWRCKIDDSNSSALQPLIGDDEDSVVDGWKIFDDSTSKQIEMAMNEEKSIVVLNKGDFLSAPLKNQCRIKFNHHSIPPQATFHRFTSLKNEVESEVEFEPIESKKADDDDSEDDGEDEIMEYIMATKHYMRPVSLRLNAKQLNGYSMK